MQNVTLSTLHFITVLRNEFGSTATTIEQCPLSSNLSYIVYGSERSRLEKLISGGKKNLASDKQELINVTLYATIQRVR